MIEEVALALLPPLLVALAVAALATRSARARPAAGALALGAGALAGHLAALGWPKTPLVLDGWLVVVAALALVAAAVERLALAERRGPTHALRALVAVLVGVALLRARAPYWEPAQVWGATALVAALLLVAGLLLERASAGRAPAWTLATWVGLASVTSGAILAAGSYRLALLAGGLAAALGALLALRLLDRGDRTGALTLGAPAVVAPVLGALVARSHVYGELPRASLALLVAAPGGAWLVSLARARLGRATEPLAATLVVALAAVAAAVAAPVEEAGYPY